MQQSHHDQFPSAIFEVTLAKPLNPSILIKHFSSTMDLDFRCHRTAFGLHFLRKLDLVQAASSVSLDGNLRLWSWCLYPAIGIDGIPFFRLVLGQIWQ